MCSDAVERLDDIPARLYLQPAGAREPPVVPQLLALDFTKIGWDDFERLTLDVAEQVDGLKNARLYGNPGQRQDGIDFYGDLDSGRACYQTRRLQAPASSDLLRSAVADFKRRGQHFGARIFTLCVAASGRDRDVLDELDKLNRENGSFTIRLYDSETLSQTLKQRRDFVHRYFGPDWANAFCGPAPVPAKPDQPIDRIDALLRGPVAALGLEQRMMEAEGATDPGDAATIFQELADALIGPFPSVSYSLRLKQADALVTIPDYASAAKIWLRLGLDCVDSSTVLPDIVLSQIDHHSTALTDHDRLLYAALRLKLDWYRGDDEVLPRLGQRFDDIWEAGLPNAPVVALWFGELCVATRDFGPLDTRTGAVAQAANQMRSVNQGLTVRLEIVLAEHSGDWVSLYSRALGGRVAPEDCGLILVRYGRWLADNAQPDQAVDCFLQAVSPMARSKWLGDAAEALYSVVEVLSDYGPADDVQRYYTNANLYRGHPKRFANDRDLQAAALEKIHGGRFPEALMLLRRFLWQSTIAGHTMDERWARNLLGDVYRKAGEVQAAELNYVLAGQTGVAELLNSLGTYVPVALSATPIRPRRLAAQLAGIEAEGDFVPDAEARSFFPTLVSLSAGVRQGFFLPTVGDRALMALGALALQLEEGQVAELLGIVGPLIPRDPTQARRSDGAIARILAAAWHQHVRLRDRARRLLAEALCQSNIGREVLQELPTMVRQDRSTAEEVIKRAEEGCLEAVLVLADAEIDHPTVAADAARRYRALLSSSPSGGSAHSIQIGVSYEPIAAYGNQLTPKQRARLTRHLCALAESTSEPEINRASAIRTVGYMARYIGRSIRGQLFDRALALAMEDPRPSDFDTLARESQHLLSSFRISFPQRDLPREALVASARLCPSQRLAHTLHPVLAGRMTADDPMDIRLAIVAYLALRREWQPHLDPRPWAEHPDSLVRSAAVALWAQDPLGAQELAEAFARDGEKRVRHQLALLLPELIQKAPEVVNVIRPILAEDPSAEIRAQTSWSG